MATKQRFLRRVPIRHRHEIIIVPVGEIASIVSEGEVLQIHTMEGKRHTMNGRLKDLEAGLDPEQFVKLGRGTLANLDLIKKVHVRPGGSHIVLLSTGQELEVSRMQWRALKSRIWRP